MSLTAKGPFVNGRVISRRRWMECSSWNRRRWMEFSQMDGSPTVDCFVVDGKGIFRRRKSDFSSTVDGVFVVESSRDSVHEQSKCIAFNLSKRKPATSPLQAPQHALSWICRLLDTREVGASERQSLQPLALNPTRQDCPSGASNSFTQRFPAVTGVHDWD